MEGLQKVDEVSNAQKWVPWGSVGKAFIFRAASTFELKYYVFGR